MAIPLNNSTQSVSPCQLRDPSIQMAKVLKVEVIFHSPEAEGIESQNRAISFNAFCRQRFSVVPGQLRHS